MASPNANVSNTDPFNEPSADDPTSAPPMPSMPQVSPAGQVARSLQRKPRTQYSLAAAMSRAKKRKRGAGYQSQP